MPEADLQIPDITPTSHIFDGISVIYCVVVGVIVLSISIYTIRVTMRSKAGDNPIAYTCIPYLAMLSAFYTAASYGYQTHSNKLFYDEGQSRCFLKITQKKINT
jgi:hypothetical protein